MADLQKYVNWDGLVYYDSKVKQFIKDKLDPCFKFGGAISFEDLPLPDEEELNVVYQITNEFISDSHFDIPEKSYESGSLVYVIKTSEDLYKFSILVESPKVDTSVIKSRLDELEALAEQSSNDIADLNNGLRDLENQVSEIDNTLSTIDYSKVTQSIEELQGSVEDIQTELSLQEEQLNSLEAIPQELQQVKHNVTAVTQKTDQVSTQVSEVKTIVETLNTTKQDKLVSGVSLATINGKSLLDGGNIEIEQKDLVCTIDKETEIEVGGIPVGTNLNGWTYSQIIQRMFFRQSTDITVDTAPVMIESAYATVYTGVSTSSSYTASETNILEENPSESKTISYTDEGLYKIYSEAGTLQETGFQVSVPSSGRGAYSQVVMNVQPVKVTIYTDLTGWIEYNGTWDVVKTVYLQSSTGEVLTYYVFQNTDHSSSEGYYRFVF